MGKLKVGDRIRVYYPDCVDNIGTVVKIVHENLLRWQNDKENIWFSAHPKQCRRLVRRKKKYCNCSNAINVFKPEAPGQCAYCSKKFKPDTLGIVENTDKRIAELEKRVDRLEKNLINANRHINDILSRIKNDAA